MANKIHTAQVRVGKKRKKDQFTHRSVIFIKKRNDVHSWNFHPAIEIDENKRPWPLPKIKGSIGLPRQRNYHTYHQSFRVFRRRDESSPWQW